MKTNIFSRVSWWSVTAVLVYLALAKLAIHLLTASNYGYFVDELYWQAIAKHLDFGYVDVPPLVALLVAISRWLAGASLFAIHILPAIAGAVMVYVAGLLAREMGGSRFAQWFTALMIIVAPGWLVLNSFCTYDPFDQLCAVILFYLIVLIIKQETPKRWFLFGIIVGIGIMIKLSMIFTVGALAIALFLTSRRKSYLTQWPWLAAFIAVAICTPFMIWQSVHGWPLLTYWHNYGQYRNVTTPLEFISGLMIMLNPFNVPFGLLGLSYLLFYREGKEYRLLGLTYLLLFIFLVWMKFESRQLIAAHFPLMAAGAVGIEKITAMVTARWKKTNWLKPAFAGILVISGTLLAPLSLPLLPTSALEQYLNVIPDFFKENILAGNRLPIQFAFRFGWPEIVKEIAQVYHGLPLTDQKKCVIWASNYGEAGAIDLLGEEYGLPKAISNHYSYQIWGPGKSGARGGNEVAIVFGVNISGGAQGGQLFSKNGLLQIFQEVNQVATINGNQYAIYWERFVPVFICRKPRISLKEVWQRYEAYH